MSQETSGVERINGSMVDLGGMNLESLEFWAEACQRAVGLAKDDLSKVEGEIASRHFLEAEPPYGDPL